MGSVEKVVKVLQAKIIHSSVRHPQSQGKVYACGGSLKRAYLRLHVVHRLHSYDCYIYSTACMHACLCMVDIFVVKRVCYSARV